MEKFEIKKYHRFIIERFRFVTILIIFFIFLAGFFIFKEKINLFFFSAELAPKNLKIKIKQQNDYLTKLMAIKNDFEKINSEQLEKLEKALPANEEILSFLIFLETLSREHNFLISSTDLKVFKTETPNFLDVNLNFQKGNYHSLKNFLELLEKNLRIIHPLNLTFSLATATYSLRMKTYFISPKEISDVEEVSLERIKSFINSPNFLKLKEKKGLLVEVKPETVGRFNPFLPF